MELPLQCYKVKSIKSEQASLSTNTKYSYYNKFRACIKEAFEDRLFAVNPLLRMKGVPQGETHREFLTLEELKAVYLTECEHPVLKRAAIFSALTGLRWSDMIKLTWKEASIRKWMIAIWLVKFNYISISIFQNPYCIYKGNGSRRAE
jgi:integrase